MWLGMLFWAQRGVRLWCSEDGVLRFLRRLLSIRSFMWGVLEAVCHVHVDDVFRAADLFILPEIPMKFPRSCFIHKIPQELNHGRFRNLANSVGFWSCLNNPKHQIYPGGHFSKHGPVSCQVGSVTHPLVFQ